MKDKKKLGTALNSIISSLRKAYDLLASDKDLQDVDDSALPRIANVIVLSLQRELAEIKENERFADMTEEEAEQVREAEKADRITKLQEASAEEFKKMCQERNPEPAQDPAPESDEDPEGDQDPDGDEDFEVDEDQEVDEDPDGDQPGNGENGSEDLSPEEAAALAAHLATQQ